MIRCVSSKFKRFLKSYENVKNVHMAHLKNITQRFDYNFNKRFMHNIPNMSTYKVILTI